MALQSYFCGAHSQLWANYLGAPTPSLPILYCRAVGVNSQDYERALEQTLPLHTALSSFPLHQATGHRLLVASHIDHFTSASLPLLQCPPTGLLILPRGYQVLPFG